MDPSIPTVFSALLWCIPALPLAGFLINGLLSLVGAGSERGADRKVSGLFAVLMPALSFACVLACAAQLYQSPDPDTWIHAPGWTWFTVAGMEVSFGLQFDVLSAFMLLFITGIGSLIVLYSVGYMGADRGYARFMAYLNLFLFSMILLVLGDNLVVTFLGWEGVGLCSYLLIGFWHRDHANNDAARKAFIVNRVGDLGLLIGVFLLLTTMELTGGTASLAYADIAAHFQGVDVAIPGILTAATLLIFLGCTGKSAQIPLLTWLPDAMAGPTPVSALIHAATMVTAGVFLISRLGDVFVLTPATMQVILIVACATALWAAIAGLVQWDIKKVLAYSTISQLGYMFMAVGIGAFDVALFHVFTHAFFKAALFLGAGSVIHALHHEQDLRRMGGLRSRLPFTHAAMVLAWLSIIGLPPGAAFFSKDLILEHLAHHGGLAVAIYVVALITAVITAIYMSRLMWYAFWGPSRVAHADQVEEPPTVMTLPVMILAVGAMAAGGLWIALVDLDFFRLWLLPVLRHAQEVAGVFPEGYDVHLGAGGPAFNGAAAVFAVVSVVAAGIGVAIAWKRFGRGPRATDVASMDDLRGFAATWTWGLDRAYDLGVVKPVQALGGILLHVVDRQILARVLTGIAEFVTYLAGGYRSFQRSRLRTSVTLSLVGAIIVLAFVITDLMSF